MIGKLSGTVDSLGESTAIVDVGGIGYVVFASGRTLGRLGGPGEPIVLWIETHVREDHIHLYGFLETAERDWFRLLSTVQGVGARMALAILTALGPDELIQAIAAQDKAALTRANGVGPKLAARIVAELKDKVGVIEWGGDRLAQAQGQAGAGAAPSGGGPSEDAVSVLVNLGYRRVDAFGAVARAARRLGDEASLETLIKQGLQELSA